MTGTQRHIVSRAAWRAVVLILLTACAAWDAAGLLIGGDLAYQSASYDVLRRISPFGMRGYGVLLGALLVTAAFAYGRLTNRGDGYRLMRISLAALAVWYTFWAAGIAGSWISYGTIYAWGSVGKLVAVALILIVSARATPHPSNYDPRAG